jgi:hypothetical protein
MSTVPRGFALGPRPGVAQDNLVRVAAWVFVLCTALGAVAVFLPSVELQLGGAAVSKRTQLSLHTASTDRALVRRLLTAYRHSERRRIGGAIVRKVTPRVGGRARAALDDARDAMDTLDDVTDDDVRTATTAFLITLWTLLGLNAVMLLLVFPPLMRGTFRRGRMAAALVAALLVAAIAVALHVACREAIWEANDELGRTALVLAPGAYALPIATLAGLVSAIVLVARRSRE